MRWQDDYTKKFYHLIATNMMKIGEFYVSVEKEEIPCLFKVANFDFKRTRKHRIKTGNNTSGN